MPESALTTSLVGAAAWLQVRRNGLTSRSSSRPRSPPPRLCIISSAWLAASRTAGNRFFDSRARWS